MFTGVINLILSNSVVKQFVNCWLAYTLSQPVDFDVSTIFYFFLQYFGITQLTEAVTEANNILQPIPLDQSHNNICNEA
jgi:hypothetical protein